MEHKRDRSCNGANRSVEAVAPHEIDVYVREFGSGGISGAGILIVSSATYDASSGVGNEEALAGAARSSFF